MALHLKSTGIDFVDFSDHANMANELLDDYEEGTWTPTAASGFSSLAVSFCSYDKIGCLVRWAFYIHTISSADSNGLALGGAPFTPSDTYTVTMPINSSNSNATKTNPHFRLSSNGVFYALHNCDASIPANDLDGSHIISAGVYRAS